MDQDGKDLCRNKDFSRFELDVKMLLKDESLYEFILQVCQALVCRYMYNTLLSSCLKELSLFLICFFFFKVWL